MKVHTLPLHFISIEDDGLHLMVEGLINGMHANLLVDTGASRSVFDMAGIQKYITGQHFSENEKLSTGLGTNSMPSMVAVIDSLALGDLMLRNYQAIIIDLTHVHQSYQALSLPEINGVIGGDVLKKYKAVINYKNRTLKLYANPKRKRPSPITF